MVGIIQKNILSKLNNIKNYINDKCKQDVYFNVW